MPGRTPIVTEMPRHAQTIGDGPVSPVDPRRLLKDVVVIGRVRRAALVFGVLFLGWGGG